MPVPWYEDINVLFKLLIVDGPIVWVLVVDQPFVPETDSTPTFALRNNGPNGHERTQLLARLVLFKGEQRGHSDSWQRNDP